jgi:hypothetical protein
MQGMLLSVSVPQGAAPKVPGLAMRFKARAATVFQFLMRCASSAITSSGAQASIRSASRASVS